MAGLALASSRKPGPIGSDGVVTDINDGTLVCNLSPLPGSTGHQPYQGLNHHRSIPSSQDQPHKGLPTLRQGSRDPLVRWAQLLLNQHGANPPLQLDSIFGAETHAAVVSFQRSQNLGANGVIGMDTWRKLVVTVSPAQGTARRSEIRSPGITLQPVAASPARLETSSVADWPLTLRFEKVLWRVPSYLSPELAMQFRAMLTPANIGILVGTLAAWAVSHSFGAGEIVDVILLAVGAFFVGMGIFKAAEDIGDCLMTTLYAQDTADLEKAANSLAQAVVILGITAFFAVLARVGARFARGGGPAAEEGAGSAGTVEEPKAAAARAGAGESAGRANGDGAGPGTVESPPKPSSKTNGDWDAPRDWSYAPKQTGRIEPGAVPTTPDLRAAYGDAMARTGPPTPDGWPQLRDSTAKTFGADPQPTEIPSGTKLYRVIGSDDSASGGFWTTDPPPATEAEWRASSAVVDKWNGDGGYVVSTVGPDGLKAWTGPVGPQEAAVDGYMLPGGGSQVWVPPGTLTPDGPPLPTAWNPAGSGH